jgi:hypothetical protein
MLPGLGSPATLSQAPEKSIIIMTVPSSTIVTRNYPKFSPLNGKVNESAPVTTNAFISGDTLIKANNVNFEDAIESKLYRCDSNTEINPPKGSIIVEVYPKHADPFKSRGMANLGKFLALQTDTSILLEAEYHPIPRGSSEVPKVKIEKPRGLSGGMDPNITGPHYDKDGEYYLHPSSNTFSRKGSDWAPIPSNQEPVTEAPSRSRRRRHEQRPVEHTTHEYQAQPEVAMMGPPLPYSTAVSSGAYPLYADPQAGAYPLYADPQAGAYPLHADPQAGEGQQGYSSVDAPYQPDAASAPSSQLEPQDYQRELSISSEDEDGNPLDKKQQYRRYMLSRNFSEPIPVLDQIGLTGRDRNNALNSVRQFRERRMGSEKSDSVRENRRNNERNMKRSLDWLRDNERRFYDTMPKIKNFSFAQKIAFARDNMPTYMKSRMVNELGKNAFPRKKNSGRSDAGISTIRSEDLSAQGIGVDFLNSATGIFAGNLGAAKKDAIKNATEINLGSHLLPKFNTPGWTQFYLTALKEVIKVKAMTSENPLALRFKEHFDECMSIRESELMAQGIDPSRLVPETSQASFESSLAYYENISAQLPHQREMGMGGRPIETNYAPTGISSSTSQPYAQGSGYTVPYPSGQSAPSGYQPAGSTTGGYPGHSFANPATASYDLSYSANPQMGPSSSSVQTHEFEPVYDTQPKYYNPNTREYE